MVVNLPGSEVFSSRTHARKRTRKGRKVPDLHSWLSLLLTLIFPISSGRNWLDFSANPAKRINEKLKSKTFATMRNMKTIQVIRLFRLWEIEKKILAFTCRLQRKTWDRRFVFSGKMTKSREKGKRGKAFTCRKTKEISKNFRKLWAEFLWYPKTFKHHFYFFPRNPKQLPDQNVFKYPRSSADTTRTRTENVLTDFSARFSSLSYEVNFVYTKVFCGHRWWCWCLSATWIDPCWKFFQTTFSPSATWQVVLYSHLSLSPALKDIF